MGAVRVIGRALRCNRWQVLLWTAVGIVEVAAFWWGARVQHAKPWVKLGAAPLVGIEEERGWDFRISMKTIPAIVLLLGVIVWVPKLAREASWRVVVVVSGLTAALVSLALALADGEPGVLDPVIHPTEYWYAIRDMPPAGEFVRTYVDQLTYYPVHYRGHPPGFMLILKGLAQIGFPGPWPVALLSLGATALVPCFVLSAVTRVSGNQEVARRCAPFLIVAPYTIWAMSSADIVFAAMGALSVWLVVVALQTPSRWPVLPLLAGIAFASFAHASYGAAMFFFTLLLVVVPIVRDGRSFRSLVPRLAWFVVGGLAVTGLFVAAGFWWVEGAAATRVWYWKGTAQFRTWTYFMLANVAVVFIATGPAFIRGLCSLRGRARWIVGGAALSIVAAMLSQLSKGEVERIWLPFYPWLTVATGAIVTHRRTWLVAQAALTLGLAITLLTKW